MQTTMSLAYQHDAFSSSAFFSHVCSRELYASCVHVLHGMRLSYGMNNFILSIGKYAKYAIDNVSGAHTIWRRHQQQQSSRSNVNPSGCKNTPVVLMSCESLIYCGLRSEKKKQAAHWIRQSFLHHLEVIAEKPSFLALLKSISVLLCCWNVIFEVVSCFIVKMLQTLDHGCAMSRECSLQHRISNGLIESVTEFVFRDSSRRTARGTVCFSSVTEGKCGAHDVLESRYFAWLAASCLF